MKIGLDLSVLQTPHRMRGIGATAINFVKNLPDPSSNNYSLVIYLYLEGADEAIEILGLKALDVNYEVRYLKQKSGMLIRLPGKLGRLNGILNNLLSTLKNRGGDQRINDLSGLDVFLQFDQMQIPPRKRGLKTAVVLYDLIPYIMESEYLWSYKTARKKGDSRKSSLRKSLLRWSYAQTARTVANRTDILLAISEHTKQDFVRFLGIPSSKIKVVHLGISKGKPAAKKEYEEFQAYTKNSWGYFTRPIDLRLKPFLLFVGGADPRRKLEHLVAAYNNLKAEGYDIRLVLAGDTMKGPEAIPTPAIQKSLLSSSYLSDITFLGFVSDEQREWLYQNTMAMVYPSVYEGFGLPILEAMQYGTPVITYKNSSIEEIAGTAAIYATSPKDIAEQIKLLLNDSELRNYYKKAGIKQADNFSWPETVKKTFSTIEK